MEFLISQFFSNVVTVAVFRGRRRRTAHREELGVHSAEGETNIDIPFPARPCEGGPPRYVILRASNVNDKLVVNESLRNWGSSVRAIQLPRRCAAAGGQVKPAHGD